MRWSRRLWDTIRHLRPIQVVSRIARRLPRRSQPDAGTAQLAVPSGPWAAPPPSTPVLVAPDRVRIHERERDVGHPAAWSTGDVPALWRYHLHYFDDLNAPHPEPHRTWQRAFMARWIAENPAGSPPGWDPYPTSLRIVNWLKWTLAGQALNDLEVRSLAQQLGHLESRLEYHLLGNHLFENAKALWFGGACFVGSAAKRWLAAGQALLLEQCAEQVLPDGGHAERSPMYHARVLEGLLDVANLERACGRPVPAGIAEPAGRMLRWLAAMSHPDGTYALLNDAAQEQSQPFAVLARYARAVGVGAPSADPGSTLLAESGYARIVVGPWVALLDLAPVGADHLTGHAHADTLTFELSLGRQRLIVDSGTSTYAPGSQRRHERSTAAHNTIEVAGLDSSEIWAAFRVGRRARIIASGFEAAADTAAAFGVHDGFVQQGIAVTHERQWRVDADAVSIIDRLDGGGTVPVVSSFHFHPDVSLQRTDTAAFACVRAGVTVAEITVDRQLRWQAEPATHHPRFGVSQPSTRLRGRGDLRLPAVIRTDIRRPNG